MRSWLYVVAVLSFPIVSLAQFNGGNAPVVDSVSSPTLAFEENLGQLAPEVRFRARGTDYTVFVTKDEVVLALNDRERGDADPKIPVARLQFAGSSGARLVEGVDPLPGVVNYYRGADPAKWQRNVKRYEKVLLTDVYPGIDFVCYGNGGQIEYDIVVHPGADPSLVRLRSVGTTNLRIDPVSGDLLSDAARGTIRHKAPEASEVQQSVTSAVAARFRIDEKREIRFDVPKRDVGRTLVIDPTILWSTLHGGDDEDAGLGIVADSVGAAYVAGYTSSTDFPTANPEQASNASNFTTDYFDVFVSKFSADGQTLLYSTYFGGELDDYGIAIAIDSANAVYVTGRTESASFPTAAPPTFTPVQTTNGGGAFDAFVFKLDAAGVLVYSTYVGGSLEDGGEGVAVDSAGNAYVAGYTWSIGAATTLFPSTTTFGLGGGVQDGFSLKLNPTGSALTYSALIGGTADETLEAIDIDAAGNAYVIGRVQSDDYPTVLPIQGARKGGYDVGVSRINAAGTMLDYSTFLGGDQDDYGVAIEVDAAGNAYCTGHVFEWTNRTVDSDTNPDAFPTTAGVVQRGHLGNWDVFVSKLDPVGQFVYSTMVGAPSATSRDQAYGIGVDPKGNATFSGNTNITGTDDVFLGKLNSTATVQLYGMLIMGSSGDFGRDLDFDQRGYAYVTGYTQSANFGAPLVNPRQSAHVGGTSAFVVVLSDSVNLTITKTDGQTTDTPGTSITYTITASNIGTIAADGVTVFDDFDDTRLSGITWTAASATVTGFTAAGAGDINDTGLSFPVGSSITYTVTATINSSATGTLTNTATVTESADVVDTDPTDNSATDTTTLTPTADLAITKTDGVTNVTAGGPTTYTITASNSGPSDVTGATVADTFPASLTATWTCVGAGGGTCTAGPVAGNINDAVNLPSGGSVTYTVNATISPAATGNLSNTATVAVPGGVTDPTPGNNSATDTDTIAQQADLSITKTDGVTNVTAGDSTTYTITASNSGPSDVTGATVADTFPASLTATWTCVGAGGGTCTAGPVAGNINDAVNLPSGGSVTYTVNATISPAATGNLSNTATVASGVTDPTPGNNSATDTDTIDQEADLSITKTDGVTNVTAGGPTTYTITASNSGPSDVTAATVADTFPASLTATWTCVGAGGGTCTAGPVAGNINDAVNLPSGGSVTYTVNATISPAATGNLSNTATVASGVTDPIPGNNSATDTDTIDQEADLSITKTDGVTNVTAGGPTTYTITASNSGPSDVTGATVADTFPASLTATWTCVGAGGGTCTAGPVAGNINDAVNLPSGASVTYTVNASISPAATGNLSNTATVGSGVTDPTPGNNSATDTDTIDQQADLSITKTDGVTDVAAGGSTIYTITASNSGPSDVTGAMVIDTFPAELTATWTCLGTGGGTCTAGPVAGDINDAVSLPSGASVTYTVNASISSAATGSVSNTATVAAPGGVTDPTPGNNSATDIDTVSADANLLVTKTGSPDPVAPGGQIVYAIGISNSGPADASTVTLTDILPVGTTFVSLSQNSGPVFSCTTPAVDANGTVTCSIASLVASASADFTLTVTVTAAGTTITNTATGASASADSDPSNNAPSTTTTVLAAPDLTGTKSVTNGNRSQGTLVQYTVVLTNNGGSTQQDNAGDEFTDVLPTGLALVSATATSGTATATIATNTVNWNGALAAGGSVTIVINATIVSSEGTVISNQGTSYSDSNGDGTNDASRLTDDPAVAGANDPTVFVVAVSPVSIPAAGPSALILLAAMLGLTGVLVMRRI